MAATLLDRLIGTLSPQRGLERLIARQRLERAYEAASPRDKWKPRRPGASAETDFRADAGILRTKARALVQNVPYIHSAMNALVAYTVGTGIKPTHLGPEKERLTALWKEWVRVADADGRMDYYGLQAAAYRAMQVDGEVLIRLRLRRPADGLPVPLQLQLLEIDWLDTERETGAAEGNEIVNGIEYDQLGRKVAFWLFDRHPGDTAFRRFMRRVTSTASRRVPADSVIHLMRADAARPGQGRGITRLAPVIPSVRDLQLYEDAELARKNLESRLGVLVSGDVSKMANPDQAGQPADQAAARATGELGALPSGGMIQLPTGVDVTVVAPHAAPGHVDYVKYRIHVILAAIGVPYEIGVGDMLDVNFSSARVRIIDFRRACEQEQWLTLVPLLCDRVNRAFVDAAQLAGKVRTADYAVDFSTPKWDYVNPSDEVSADIDEISMGLSSISEKLRRRNYDPEQVFAELESDFKRLEKSGVLQYLLLFQRGSVRRDETAAGSTTNTPTKAAAKA